MRAAVRPPRLLSLVSSSRPVSLRPPVRCRQGFFIATFFRMGDEEKTEMTRAAATAPRRFRGLGKDGGEGDKLKGIVFDVDGTLCEPQNYMFAEMRQAAAIPPGHDILHHIASLPSPERERAMSAIKAVETAAMTKQTAQPGLVPLMAYLDSRSVPKAILTRNFDAPVEHLLGKFLAGSTFHPIVTRAFEPPKPAPDGIWHIAREWGLGEGVEGGRGLIMVGDSLDDMTAGYRAGAATVLLVNEVNAHLAEHEHTDLCIRRLDELVEVLENGFVGRIGRGEEGGDTRARAEEVLQTGRREGMPSA